MIKVSRGLDLEMVPLCSWHSIAKSQNQADSQGGELASAPLWEDLQSQSDVGAEMVENFSHFCDLP